MTTVIDELILRLGLDITDLTVEEARLAQSLRRMEEMARRGGERVQESVGQGTIQFFRMLEAPVAGLRRQFESLATLADPPRQQLRQLEDQGRRTGEAVEGGALAGARGLRVLGAAGLAVFAAYEALSRTITAANSGAQRLFGTGIGAASAGLGIGEFTAVSQALRRGGNVPLEQTQATLGELRAAQVGYAQAGPAGDAARSRLVALNAGLAGLGYADVDVWRDSPELVLAKVAAHLAATPDAQFNPANVAAQLGMPIEEVYGLRQVGRQPGGLDAATEAERVRAATEGQSAAAHRLVEATNNLSNAWDHLNRVMGGVADGPLARLVNALAWIVDHFATPSATSAAIGTVMGPGGLLIEGLSGNPPAGPADSRNWWQRYAPTWLGGRPPPTASTPATPSPLPSLSSSSIGGSLLPGLTTDDVAIMQRESQGKPLIGWSGMPGSPEYSPGGTDLSGYPLDANGFPAWPGKMGPQGNSTAAGLFMITKTNWDRIAPRLGIHDFSPASQLAVRRELQREALAAGLPANSAWAASGIVLPVGGAADVGSSAPRDIQLSQATGGDTHVTHNAGDVNLNGDIVVNAPLREGSAIADAVEARIRRVTLATTSNSGLN